MQDKEHWEYERLSALLDSALDEHEWDAALSLGDDAQGRERLAMYEYIGDVLRSPDLARHTPQRSEALLQSLRERLRDEPLPGQAGQKSAVPVVQPVEMAAVPVEVPQHHQRPAANDSVFRWKMVAGVATCAAVLGVVWGSGMLGSAAPAGQWAAAPAPAPVSLASAPSRPAASVVVQLPARGASTLTAQEPLPASLAGRGVEWGSNAEAEGPAMIRDPRLDELMAAQRQYGGAAALQLPAEFLRNANFEGRRP